MKFFVYLAEHGFIPDTLLRAGIRHLCGVRKKEVEQAGKAGQEKVKKALMEGVLAVHTQDANAQHYEVPTEFFTACLGPHKKYSACYFNECTTTLEQAELDMLARTIETAHLANDQRILELGCGWGSLTLEMAKRFPQSSITAVSNSATQKKYIDEMASAHGLTNVLVITTDINTFTPEGTFDRIVSVEMFEHLRNWKLIFERASSWLRDDGALFIHVFTNKKSAYLFEDKDGSDWMSRNFFTGGVMPSRSLVPDFASAYFILDHEEHFSGVHYQLTSEAWLANQRANKAKVIELFARTHGTEALGKVWFHRWEMFFLAVAELFGYDNGNEWGVSHYRLRKMQ